jgi:NADH oxidoreductase Hcr
MTMPTSQCPWRMQVHHIHQETPDVWTLSLLCHDYYPYRAGQYALVSVRIRRTPCAPTPSPPRRA